ncbi:MAG: glycosyltransferase family 2 protein [Coriobacteriales bacterium]|jgi:glycosyltransferase involved in cell wall biosynthesis|nr:glycosyltransferase family 2 protein [Coriobacteriales bacterium]
MRERKIAVLIPCYNEEQTIGKVIDDFARELPHATIYVYDNNSSDNSVAAAKEHGAVVRLETRQGKGNVVRQMFREIDADYYVMVDGDDTYPAEHVHDMLQPLFNGETDMVIGDRLSNRTYKKENKRAFHSFGNNLVRFLIYLIYRVNIVDVLTGYRAFNRIYVRTCPIISRGFEVETELTIHTIDKNWRFVEVPIEYRDRPLGSESKLSTFDDGFKVLLTIFTLFKDYKPLVLFTLVGAILMLVGIVLGGSVVVDFVRTGLVERFPTAILAVGFVVVGLLAISCGLILDTTVKGWRKQYELTVSHDYAAQERSRRYTDE